MQKKVWPSVNDELKRKKLQKIPLELNWLVGYLKNFFYIKMDID